MQMNHWHSFTTSSVSDGYIYGAVSMGEAMREKAAGGPLDREGVAIKSKEGLAGWLPGTRTGASTDTWRERASKTRLQQGVSQT